MTGPGDSPTLTVPVEAAVVIFDELVEAVTTRGARVTLTRDGAPVAVIVPWAWYRHVREVLAQREAAYWTAWSDAGDFDGAAYAYMVADLNDPPEPPSITGNTPAPAPGGDG